MNNLGGTLKIVSRVSDKNSGDIGHPVQWDGSNWYIGVSTVNNGIYSAFRSLGVSGLGQATARTYVTRKTDSRSLIDTVYRVRYVLPKDSSARPPIDGFILQESNNIVGVGTNEISQLYDSSGSISNSSYLRNPKFIADATWSTNVATIRTEIPHNLKVGDQIQIVNVIPTTYNGTYTVSSIVSHKEFTYSLTTDPVSSFGNNTSQRDSTLPYVVRKKYNKIYQIYRTQEIKKFIKNKQDGIYYLTVINNSNYPTVSPFTSQGFSQPITNLYPQINLDDLNSDPNASISYALPDTIGQVVVDDLQNSITKETLESFSVGFGITNIRSISGTAHTIYTTIDHGFSGITSVSIVSAGSSYGSGTSGSLYNAKLVGFAGSTTGSNATAKITINALGQITGVVKIIDGGSAYGIGNTLRVVGVASTAGFVEGVVRVASVNNNIGDILKVSGVSLDQNSEYNDFYRITGINTGNTKEINVVSSRTITNNTSTGVGVTSTVNSKYFLSGRALQVNSISYTASSGLATVTFARVHNLKVDNKIRIGGANQSEFNGDFLVKNVGIGTTACVIKVGVSVTTSTSATGTIFAYRSPLTSQGGDLLPENENASGRIAYEYAGITTNLGASISISSTDPLTITIPNAISLGLEIGDYLLIDSEIFKIKNTVTSNSVVTFRALLGSPKQSHNNGAVVTKIRISPVELRRNSIIRASGHTFEYLGFGPGNYSTSLPEKQSKSLSNQEKFLAQSTKIEGGVVVYTGMNSDGDFFAGNKKINSATGKEESFDTPFPTNTGEKEIDNLVNITETQKLFATSSIKVEGGRDKNIVSEFEGPVVMNNKLTSNSEIETNSLLIQGDEKVSRKITVSNVKPTVAGNYGDIVFNSTPSNGQNVGWVYTTSNEWKSFGTISS